MIELSQEQVFSILIKAFILGVLIGAVYETVRLCRLVIDAGERQRAGGAARVRGVLCILFTFFSDILFCLAFAVIALLLTFNVSGGIFRGGVYFMMLTGLISYRATFARLVFKIEKRLAWLIKKTVRGALKLIFIPIRAIFLIFVRLYTLTIGKILCKIRYKRILKKEQELIDRQKKLAEAVMPVCEEEISKDVNKSTRYGKEGRISFGGYKDTRRLG